MPDFGSQPVDYASIIGQGQKLAFNPLEAQQTAAQTGLMNAQAQAENAQVDAAQQKQQRFAQFQNAIHTYDGSATSASKLIAQFPEYADQLKSSWDLQDNAKKQSDLTQLGEIYSAASGGNWKLAQKLSHQRADAEKANGYSDPAYDAALEVMDKAADGDPTSQKVVLNLVGTHLAAVTGPDHFGTVYGALNAKDDKGYTLDAGAARFDGGNHMVAHSPFIKGEDGSIRAWNDGPATTEGGGPASGAGGGVSPAAASVATALASSGIPAPVVAGFMGNFHAEGGYDGAQGDGGSASGIGQWRGERAANFERIIGKPVTESTPIEQAKFVSWEMQNPEAAGMTVKQRDAIMAAKTPAQAAALIDKFYERSSGRDRNIRMSAATAFAGGQGATASATPQDGAFPVLIPGKGKEAPAGFQWKADGTTLEPIPGGPQDPAAQEGAIDDQTATFYAQDMLNGGQMPTLGMGKQAAQARQQILKKVAQLAGADGLTGKDLSIQIAHYKAGLGNVQNLEKQAGTIEQNEKTALANGQQFIDRSRELTGQTRFPMVNSVTQSYLRHTGDPTVAAMDSAWQTFTTEYAKVVAGSPSGAGTLSDSARHEAMETMKGNYALPQKLAAFKQMQADMANRMSAIHGQVAKGYQTLGERAPGLAGSPAQAPSLPPGAKVVGTLHGKRVIEVNGKRMVEQ